MTWIKILVLSTATMLAGPTALAQAPSSAIPDAATWRGLGIHPVNPPLPLLDATLPTTQGSQVRLSDAKGQWLILSFFATWCGPCRAEFPSMIDLWQATHKAGLDLFAISAEDNRGLVTRYADDLNLPFPVLHDIGGRISANYRVSSLPTSFIVAPSGDIVGRVVGARNWAELIPAFEAIMRGETPSVMPAAPVELPPLDDPPTATVTLLSPEPVEVDEPFLLAIDVQWSGRLQDYLLKPPTLPEIDGLDVIQVQAKSSAKAGESTVRYEYTVQASAPQILKLDPIRLNYRDGRNGADSGTEAKGVKIEVFEPTSPLEDWRIWTLLGGIGLFGFGWTMMRRRKNKSSAAASEPSSDLSAALEALRTARIRGDHVEFVARCQEIARQGNLESEDYITSDLANAVQYGGHRIPEIDLDQIERKLKEDLQVSD
ncbi:MAG: TlpA disulfide reductase family protein [Myxococcota bacterium]|nr:TlpA disulfide reductase family protein [Myxococcota bacterium]